MCERCLRLQVARDRAWGRLREKERQHGGGIPVGHPDIVFLKAVREIDEACKASFRRHYHDTPNPTCIVCGSVSKAVGTARVGVYLLMHWEGQIRRKRISLVR